jgi:hypothetical protein
MVLVWSNPDGVSSAFQVIFGGELVDLVLISETVMNEIDYRPHTDAIYFRISNRRR